MTLRDTTVNTFRAHSLDVEGAATRLSLEFEDVDIDRFEADTMSTGNIGSMIIRESRIQNIDADAFG